MFLEPRLTPDEIHGFQVLCFDHGVNSCAPNKLHLDSLQFDQSHPFSSYTLQLHPASSSFPPMSKPAPHAVDVDACPESFVCPLSQVPPGTLCRVKQLLASPEIALRLRELGFCEQQQIRLLTHERTMICQVCNARLGISSSLAKAIMVEPIPVGARAA